MNRTGNLGERVYGDEVPEIPTETRCETCGRVIPFRYVFAVAEPADDESVIAVGRRNVGLIRFSGRVP